MLDIRSAARGAVKAAPTYLVSRIPTVMAGSAACYVTLLLLMGPLSFFYTIWNLLVLCVIVYAVHVGSKAAVSLGVTRLAAWLEEDGALTKAGVSTGASTGTRGQRDKLDPQKLD